MRDRAAFPAPAARRSLAGERGFLMAALAASIAVLVIFSTLAFQEWIDVLRRDNEAEMMFRAKDLVRAIQRYRKDHAGVGPPRLEDLKEPGPRGQYYLRQLWKDPLTKDGKWGLLYVGPGGQIVDPNETLAPTGLEEGVSGFPQRERVDVFNRGREESEKQETQRRPTGPGSQSLAQPQAQPQPRPISADDPGADPNAGGKQLGGLPVAGVRSLCKDKPFRVYNGLTEYSEWKFTYLDLELPQGPGGRGPGAPPRGGAGGSPFGKGKGRRN